MSEPVRWSVELAPADLAELAQQLEWALQHQNRALAQKMPAARIPIHVRRLIGAVLSGVGLALVLDVCLTDPRTPRVFTIAGIAVFSLSLVTALALPQLRVWSRRHAGRSIARRAASLLRPLACAVPATIEYELSSDHLAVRSEQVPALRPIVLGRRFLVATERAVFVFGGRPTSQLLRRAIYVPGEVERRAVLDAFARYSSTHVELEGPVEGYADRVPPARVHA